MKQTKIIAIANHKGGVGKTTVTASVGSILARKGFRVLVIDFDFQANLTTCLLKEPPTDPQFYMALTEKADALPVVHVSDNLDLVPATEELAAAELEMVNRMMREFILKKLLHISELSATALILLSSLKMSGKIIWKLVGGKNAQEEKS